MKPGGCVALDRLEVIADTFLSMNAPVQWALPAWLEGCEAIQKQIRARVRRTWTSSTGSSLNCLK